MSAKTEISSKNQQPDAPKAMPTEFAAVFCFVLGSASRENGGVLLDVIVVVFELHHTRDCAERRKLAEISPQRYSTAQTDEKMECF